MKKLDKKYGLLIDQVAPGSIAEQVGLSRGDLVLAVNSEPLCDLISLELALASGHAILTIQSPKELWELDLELDEDETLGITFQRAVSSVRLCQNKCPFCFIHQMPPSLRSGLYVRDDDWRLSFLQGNYITLTNLEPQDWERIICLGISPLFISIHTTNPKLRGRLLDHPKAGKIMEQLRALAKEGISFHGQLVLIPGINDGPHLEQSFRDLASLRPALCSLAVVPVGLTAFREGLPKLRRLQPKEAVRALQQVDSWQTQFRKEGPGTYYAADEFFLLAGRPIPEREYYDDYPQLENGVGIVRFFLDSFERELPRLKKTVGMLDLELATGKLALPILQEAARRIEKTTEGRVRLDVVGIDSFLGHQVTVAGLLAGRDFLKLPEDRRPLLIPDLCLNADGVFLDDLTLGHLSAAMGREVWPVPTTGNGLIDFLEKELCK